MENHKISFLIPAHNEENIISKTLENLSNIPYDNYEILVGLDGCTDKTEEIVKSFGKKSKKLKYFNLKSREGKPQVIDFLIKKSEGDIIIINDADWKFFVKDKKSLEKYLDIFKDNSIGGIAESFPIELNEKSQIKGNLGFKLAGISSKYWFQYQKKKFTKKLNNSNEITNPFLFLTNIFRKELYKKNYSLGDDFERTREIMKKGKKIILFDDPSMPRMVALYKKLSVRDLYKQKVRTAIARKQLSSPSQENSNGQFKLVIYMFVKSWTDGIKPGFLITFWIFLMIIATINSKFKKLNTKEAWVLRAKR